MDSFPGPRPENVLNSDTNRDNSHPFNKKSTGDIGIEVASKYLCKRSETLSPRVPTKSVNYSSDDDSDTDYSSMSLVALAAKHKNNTLPPKTDFSSSLGIKQYESSDSSSETESSSLIDLMRKNKVKDTDEVDGCLDVKIDEMIRSPDVNETLKTQETIGFEGLKNFNDDTVQFVKVNLLDETDDEEPMCLLRQELLRIQVHTSGSANDVRLPKPKFRELEKIANFHRHHTKSESDGFNSASSIYGNVTNKSSPINVSTSLRSLGGGFSEMDFKFSPGGSIPGSFKSLAINSLNSSQNSVRNDTDSRKFGSNTDMYVCSCNEYSDSDMSQGSSFLDRNFGKTLYYGETRFETSPADIVDKGINLFGALKTSVSPRTSESLMSEDNVDDEDEKFVTLLDRLMVDDAVIEEGDKKKSIHFDSELEESCMIDISHLLKVRIKLRTKRNSSFGKVICRKWKSLRIDPYIRTDKYKKSIVPFDFLEPSPDDVVASAFKRRPL